MTITINELDPDQYGRHRIEGTATLGDGTKKVIAIDEDRDAAVAAATIKAERAERALAAIEVHDPEDLEHFRQAAELDLRILKAPDGTVVEATGPTVAALLAAGYEEHDQSAIPQRTNEHPGSGITRKSARRTPKKPADEM